jgi:hypothetical protein
MGADLLTEARQRVDAAKVKWTAAAQAAQRADPAAADLADVALQELTSAQTELRRLTEPTASEWLARARLS